MHDLIEMVEQWAEDRNLIKGSNPTAQLFKLKEEVAELEEVVIGEWGEREIMLEMGDVLVVMIIMCAQLNISLTECLELTYNKIKHRKGIMHNGIFYKEGDERYRCIAERYGK